jgi:putative ABC transport system permease protein
VTPLDRKLLRDLRRLWLQAVAVGVVLGCGIAIFVMATGMYGSLEVSRDQYYARSLMADLAGSLVRAPDRIAADLAAEPDIAGLEVRAVCSASKASPSQSPRVSSRFLPIDDLG